MIIEVFGTSKIFNLDLRSLEKIFYVNLGWVGLWIHPKLVSNGKVSFPIKNCDAVKIGNEIIVSEGNKVLHYIRFNDRLITNVYGLSYIDHFLPETGKPVEVLILSTAGNNIYIETQQVIDVNLNPIEIKKHY